MAQNLAENPKFSNLLSDSLLIKNLTEGLGFETPTPIQVEAAGTILEGKDIFAGARTGSGKTIAFLAPLIERMRKGELNRILVLAPTRELVQQIDEEAMSLLEGQKEISPIALFGGVPTDQHVLAMKHHDPRIYLANPGRFIDLLQQEEVIPAGEIEAIVLDEADRMCDMGFSPQVDEILSQLKNRKQNLFFSATLPKELNGMMEKYSRTPVRIQVDSADESADTIEHKAVFCSRRQKPTEAKKLLMKSPDLVSVVFTKTRKGADQLFDALKRDFKGAGIIHAGYSQPERERTIQQFRDQKIKALICTDVMARGIDVSHINRVIHYDLPENLEDYIHRAGRSGRAGREGESIAFVERDNRGQVGLFYSYTKTIEFKTLEGEPIKDQKDLEREPTPARSGRNQRKQSSKKRSSKKKRSGGHRGREKKRDSSESDQKRPSSSRRSKKKSTKKKTRSSSSPKSSRPSSAPPKQKKATEKNSSLVGRVIKKFFRKE